MLSLLVVSAIAAPAHLYPGVGAIYKGPDSETIVKGPDGSKITSSLEGAYINREEELEPIVGPAPHRAAPAPHHAAPVAPARHAAPAHHAAAPKKEEEKPKAPLKKVEGHGGKAKGGAHDATEEVVGIAEEAVKKSPKSDAVIFALEEPEGYGYSDKESWGNYEGGDEGEYDEKDGEGEEEEGEEDDEEYDPFVIKSYY